MTIQQYDEYKDSGIAWLGSVPKHWDVKRLKLLGQMNKGLTFTKSDLENEGYPVISYGKIHSKQNKGTRINSELLRFIPEEFIRGSANSLVTQGDFIFADTSEDYEGCGNYVYVDSAEPSYGRYHTIVLRMYNEWKRYLAYLFLTDCWRTQIRSLVSGVKVYSITQSILSSTTVCLPPLSEQEAIVRYLDERCREINRRIELEGKRIELLVEVKQSIITQAVTEGLAPNTPKRDSGVEWLGQIPQHWEIRKTSLICPFIGSGTTPSTSKKE